MASLAPTSVERVVGSAEGGAFGALGLICSGCRQLETTLVLSEQGIQRCQACGFHLEKRGGIVRALPPDRERYYAKFVEEYSTIRRAEGRGSEDQAYYLALPYEDLSGKLADQWAIRAKSYAYFERRILAKVECQSGAGLQVADLGAGTGWLSYRLALRGHKPVAVDILTDPLDGLGAANHYFTALEKKFPLFQAEFDNLPFVRGQFDLVVFNSSLHYSTDYKCTLGEALRCLRPGGQVVIMDSPIYRRSEHGERMREERHRQFEATYGFASNSIPSIEYLDKGMPASWSRELGLRWEIHRPWYGGAWALRPWKARLAGRRPPSRFRILVGSTEPQ